VRRAATALTARKRLTPARNPTETHDHAIVGNDDSTCRRRRPRRKERHPARDTRALLSTQRDVRMRLQPRSDKNREQSGDRDTRAEDAPDCVPHTKRNTRARTRRRLSTGTRIRPSRGAGAKRNIRSRQKTTYGGCAFVPGLYPTRAHLPGWCTGNESHSPLTGAVRPGQRSVTTVSPPLHTDGTEWDSERQTSGQPRRGRLIVNA